MSNEPNRNLVFICCYCKAELNETQIFKFRETVGCESCVRDYSRDRPSELEFQLHMRRKNATAWLERNRKDFEKWASTKKA